MSSETNYLDKIRSQFQVISDTHLEKMSQNIIPDIEASAPYLILAGDIGYPNQESYWRFLEDASTKFQLVFLILGNKEYHVGPCHFVPDFVRKMIDRRKLWNVIFLDGNTFDIEIEGTKVRIMGCTLWTYVDRLDMDRYRKISYHRADGSIGTFGELNNSIFMLTCKWLDDQMSQCERDGYKCIVITHHVPSFKLLKLEYRLGWNNYMNEYYASDCEHLLRDPVIAWYYGHTQDVGKGIVNDIPCYVGSYMSKRLEHILTNED